MAKQNKFLNFNIVITQDQDGMFVADCPAIPGCHSQGETYEEAEKNIKEVIRLCLKVAKKDLEYKNRIDFESGKTPRMVSISTITIPSPNFL